MKWYVPAFQNWKKKLVSAPSGDFIFSQKLNINYMWLQTAEGHKVTSAHRNPKFVEIDNVHHPDLESYLHMTESPSEELEDIECIEDRHGCRLKQEICSNDNGDISR